MAGQPTPPIITQPFGKDAAPEYIQNPIPVAPGAEGRANFDEGFPPITMTPVVAGGVPPFGQDVNGILYMATAHIAAAQAGQPYAFNADVAAAMGGYKIGCVLAMSDGTGLWLNTVDGNTTNPDGGSAAGWVALYRYGYTAVAGLTGGAVTLTAAQARSPVIVLAGTLVANVQVNLPNTLQEWLIVNNCTGAYTLTVKTAAGTGVDIPQGGYAAPVRVYGDGLNLYPTVAPLTIPTAVAATPDTYVLRDNLGGVYATRLYQSSGLEVPTVGAVFVQNAAADGALRKISITNFEAQLLLQNMGGVLINAQVPYGVVAQHAPALFSSPAFTGTPTAPTAPAGTSTTQVATTAFANPGQALDGTHKYTTLPGGVKVQWGTFTAVGDTTTNVSFRTNFTAAPTVVAGGARPGQYGDQDNSGVVGVSTTGFSFLSGLGGGSNYTAWYIAIGV